MDKINYKELLLNSYLTISNSTAGLKDIAYAKLIFFILYLDNGGKGKSELKESISNFIGSKSIPNASLDEAINLLKSRRLVTESDNKISITPDEYIKTTKKIEYSKNTSKNICTKYFPNSIDADKIESWFNETNEIYFSAFAEKLIELYNKKKSLILGIEKILTPTIKQHGLESYKNDLIQGYREFLLSGDREAEEKIWNLMQSLLSAKIIKADLSPDLLSIDKYIDAEILIDTNILFANTLASNTGIEETVNSFGKIAKTIGAKLYITNETIDEYQSVCERKKLELIILWNSYSIEILNKANSKDGFLRSLLQLGCDSEEAIERFFSVVCKPPTKIGDSQINVFTHDEIYEKNKDKELYEEIKKAWIERHEGWEKPDGVIVHDLIITKLCKKHSLNKKMFALTLDISLEALSLNWINEKEDPIWRSLYSLVQILAINGGGPDFDSNDLAPLVKIFIEQEELGRSDSYDKRDLLLLTEISDRLKELPDTKVVSLLNKIHFARMSDASDQQAIKDIKLELDRSLVKQTHELSEVISEKEEEISNLQNKHNKEIEEKDSIIKRNKLVFFALRAMLCIALSVFLFLFLGDDLMEKFKIKGTSYDVIQILLFVISPMIFIYRDIKKNIEF